MGQYITRATEITVEPIEAPQIQIEAEAYILNQGYTVITIPKDIFEELGPQDEPAIYKIILEQNGEKHIYYIEYQGKEVIITFSELKPGKYTVTIQPYNTQDFIKDFNQKAQEKYNIQIEKTNNTLILKLPNGETIETQKWTYQKEHGGAVKITAEYPSETRPKTTLIYKLKRDEAHIKILSPRKEKRDTQEPVTKIEPTEHAIAITYKHGKKQKTTYIPVLDITYPMTYEIKRGDIEYNLKKEYENTAEYVVEIIDDRIYRALQRIYIFGYKVGKKGNIIKESIGTRIASNFLTDKLGYDILDNSIIENLFRNYYKVNVKPDLIAYKGNVGHIIEVKFLSNPNLVKLRLREAEREINRQIKKLEKTTALEDLGIQYKTIILVTYNFREGMNRGNILIKSVKI